MRSLRAAPFSGAGLGKADQRILTGIVADRVASLDDPEFLDHGAVEQSQTVWRALPGADIIV